MVKLVRAVCKEWRIGKCWYKRKNLGLCVKIHFGNKFRL